jgi:hypothetical protein
MAQNCPAETGVIAANTTATRQKNAINFRAEIIDSIQLFPWYTEANSGWALLIPSDAATTP